jgi:hypothetical protein
MKPDDMPKAIFEKIQQWFNGVSGLAVLHFWEQDGTYFVVARPFGTPSLWMLRVFLVGHELQLSQDNVIHE